MVFLFLFFEVGLGVVRGPEQGPGSKDLIPLGVGGLVEDVGGNVGDLLVIEAASESGHGVLAVGDLRVGVNIS